MDYTVGTHVFPSIHKKNTKYR